MFAALGTQWNVGPAGAVGLRYEVLPAIWGLCGVPRADRPDVFAALRIMEREALATFRAAR